MSDFATLVLGADASGLLKGKKALEDVVFAGGKAETATGKAGDAFKRTGNDAAAAALKVLGISKAFRSVAVAAGALLGTLAASMSLRTFIDATVESEKVQAQLAAALKSTGGAAGRTIEQLNATAAGLQKVTTFGDDSTNAMQALLLTFSNIKGEKFDQATVAVQNLATAMGSDLQSAALQVGKALNDPVLGMTALSRSGIQFSESQKAAVAAMVATNDVAGAQTIILAELERQFGGSAEAARNTLGGALAALGNAWGDLFEIAKPGSEGLRLAIEGLVTAVSNPAFVGAVQAIGTALFKAMSVAVDAVAFLANHIDTLLVAAGAMGTAFTLSLIPATLSLAGAAGIAGTAVGTLTAIILANPIGAMAVGVGLLVAGLWELKKSNDASKTAAGQHAIAEKELAGALDSVTVNAANAVAEQRELLEVRLSAARVAEVEARVAYANAQAILMMSQADGSNIDQTGAHMMVEQAQEALDKASSTLAVIVEAADALNIALSKTPAELARAAAESTAMSDRMLIAKAGAYGIADAINKINWDAAAKGAIYLAAQLGVSLKTATALNATLDRVNNTTPAKYGPAATAGGLSFGVDPVAVNKVTAATLGFADATDLARMNAEAAKEEAKALAAGLGGGSGSGGGVSGAASDAAKSVSAMASEIKALEFKANPILDYNEQLARLDELAANGLSDGAYRKAVDELNDSFANSSPAVGKVADAIGNFVASGLKDFKSLLGAFKSMILQMIATAVANPIKLALGMTGGMGGSAASAATGAAGGGGGAGGILGSIGGIGGAFSSGLSSVWSALGTGGLSGAAGAISTAVSGITLGTGALASFATAIGAIALPVAAVAAVFSFFKTKTKELDAGMRITADTAATLVEEYKTIQKTRFWGLSKKTRTNFTESDNASPVTAAIESLKTQGMALGEVLGLTAANFASFSSQIKFSLAGMSDAEAQAEIQRVFGVLADDLAYAALGSFQVAMGNVIKDGENASAAMERLVNSLLGVNDVATLFGSGLLEMSVAGGVAASALVDLVGGLDNFNSKAAYVFSNMLTDTEQKARKVAIATDQLNAGFGALGISIPQTHAQYMSLLNAQDLMTDSGRTAYSALLNLSSAFVEVNGTAQAAVDLGGAISGLGSDMEAATAAAKAYVFSNMLTDTEQKARKVAIATDQLNAGFGALGISIPQTHAQYMSLLNAQDLMTESGRTAYSALLNLSSAFVEVNGTAQAAADAAAKAAADAAAQSAADAAAKSAADAAAQAYVFSNMLTDTEQKARKVAIATDQLNAGFGALGISIPQTHAQYMSLLSAQDLMTESGRTAYSALLNLSSAFVEVNGTAQAAVDLGGSLSGLGSVIAEVNQYFAAINAQMFGVSSAGQTMAASLVALLGGIEGFNSATAFFTANFYSEAEQLQAAANGLNAQFAALNLATPPTVAAFRKLVEAQDLTTSSGQSTYAALMKLAPAFMNVANAAASAANTASAAAAAAAGTTAPSTVTAADVTIPATGTLADAQAAALAAQKAISDMAAATAADAKAAADAAAKAAADAARKAASQSASAAKAATAAQIAADQASERYGLETKLLDAQGQTAALRKRELDALYPANRALQTMIWSLEDAAVKADKAKAVADERYSWETKYLTAIGDTAALRERELATIDPANRAYAAMVMSLEDAATSMSDLTAQADKFSAASRAVFADDLQVATRRRDMALAELNAQIAGGKIQEATTDRILEALSNNSADQYSNVIDFERARAKIASAEMRASNLLQSQAAAGAVTQAQYMQDQLAIGNSTVDLLGTGFGSVSSAIEGLASSIAAWLSSMTSGSVPGFAGGGVHRGGLRVVGENGPELEYTPPSRIFSNSQSQDMLAGDPAVREELVKLNEYIRELVKLNAKQERRLREIQFQGEIAV